MSEITLVKNDQGQIEGFGEADKRAWNRFKKNLRSMEPGELVKITTKAPRVGAFHRRHMKMENVVFDSQERIGNFDQFRYWLKVGAGFVDWMAGARGGVIPVPKSISYEKCDEDEMREFHRDAVDFLRTDHAAHYLWPHLPVEQALEMIEVILRGFGE
jgi:TusA-related sulfurtransferase